MHGTRGLWHTAIVGCVLALAIAPVQAHVAPTAATPAATAAAKPRALVLGVFPRYSMANTLAMFTPLADRLSRAVGREVRLETARDFKTFWQQVAEDRYDVVHYNQYHYIKAHRLLGHRAIARNEEHGDGTVTTAIIVRRDSGIDSLTALRAQTVYFGRGRHAMQGYIAPASLLRRAGLKAEDYQERFAHTPCDAIIAVYRRQAVAGGGPSGCLSENLAVDADELKVLAMSEPIARSPWAVAKSVQPALARSIATALFGLDNDAQGRAILARARLSAIAPAHDADYAAARAIVAEVLHERY